MGVGLPAKAETLPPSGEEEALRSEVVQARPLPVSEPTARNIPRLTELLRNHYTQVWRTVRHFGVDELFADDAVQKVFMVLADKLDDVIVGSEGRFLLSAAVRIASNYRQSWHHRHQVFDERALADERDPLPTAEQLLDEKRLREAFDELLERWPEDIRTAFVLFELEGLTMPEIAELTEAKIGTVASRLRRGRALFQAGVKRLKARGTAGSEP